jgi:16S rRNA (cytidine1402-2'-O)-methyltransferase
MVFFESPHRTGAALTAMAEAFGDGRPGAVCRELTKTYEEVRRGTLADLVTWAADGVRGEVTIVIAGAPPAASSQLTDNASLREAVDALVDEGSTRKDAIAAVARSTGLPKREVYQVVHSDD